jgi:hypothetical protein
MDELTYEVCDEDGLPQQGHIRPKWQLEPVRYREILARIFAVYGRKYFADAEEQKAWKKICKALDKGMSLGWIDNCLDWVKTKLQTGSFIPFWTLENLILNAVKEREWIAKNKMASREIDEFVVEREEDSFDIE